MDYRPKKGLDIWLNEKGFYRKHVAMDETCFFRAVSDQMYNTQIYHEDIRKLCVKFANNNRELFKDLLGDSEWKEHIDKLQKHFVVCGDIEVQIACKMLKRDFIIVDANNFTTDKVTNNGYEKLVTLCKMRDNHYDSVCSKEHIENSGFCQSLVYKLLYEEVFDFENVDDIVQTMLYPDNEDVQQNSDLFDSIFPTESEDKDDITKNPPFPYKVAKALDPNQYRNIEFDAWNQIRKELRLKDWYLGGKDFKIGTKCLLVVENNTFDSYIQQLNYQGEEDMCLVYVVEWASKEIVKREELMPLPDAKPWPLPYGIARNAKSSEIAISEEIVEEPKPVSNKKRRNRHRTSNNNNNSLPQNDNNNNTTTSVNCYEGCSVVASPNSQYEDENVNNSAICLEEENLHNSNCSLPFKPLMRVQLDPNYYNLEEDPLEVQSYNEDSLLTESNWTNYQTWLSSGNVPAPNYVSSPCCAPISCCTPVMYPAPYGMPSVCLSHINPQMFVVTQHYNTLIQQDSENTKVTTMLSSNYIERTYLTNNQPVPNWNCQLCPNQMQIMPCPNYTEHQPQMMPNPNYPEYKYPMMPVYEPPVVLNYPQVMPGPSYPKYESRMTPGPIVQTPGPLVLTPGPMMPMPPPTPVSCMPIPMRPMPSIYPCYLVINPAPFPQPQTNVPMLEPNVTVPQVLMVTPEEIANNMRLCDCNNFDAPLCSSENVFPPRYFSEY